MIFGGNGSQSEVMRKSGYDYEKLVHDSLIGVVRHVMADAAINGLPGNHHFYLTFATGHPKAVLPDYLRVQYPDEMPVVLQHQFWGLEIGDEAFEVTLSFKGVQERLRVPFDALTSFADPSVNFALRLGVVAETGNDADANELAAPADQSASRPAPVESGESGNVVSIDTFRKR